MVIPEHLIPMLEEMYYELSIYRLEVILVPSLNADRKDNGCLIRRACSENVEWYKNLCSQYPSTRKRKNNEFDTKIKRQYIQMLLERMIRNKKTFSVYADDLIQVAKDRYDLYESLRIQEEKEFKDNLIPWDNQF